MKLKYLTRIVYGCFLITSIFLNSIVLFAQTKSEDTTFEKVNILAKEFLLNFVDKKFEKAHSYFDNNVKTLMSLEKLNETQGQLNTAFGVFNGTGEISNSKMDNLLIAEVVLNYEKSKINARLVFDSTNKISGLFFMPIYEKTNKDTPNYIDTTRFIEEDIEFGNPDWSIKGSLCIPKYKKSMYAVVMLSGSGPNNRNSEIGPNSPFLDIAHGLSTSGIMTLRFDKRTKLYGKKMYEMTNSQVTLNEEYYEDTDYAIDFINRYANYLKIEIKGIIVLGHSQGGSVLPFILENSKYKDKISAGIMLAAPARNFEDILIEQYKYIFSLDNLIDEKENIELDKLMKQVEKVKNIENFKQDKDLPLGLPYQYWISLAECKPLENIKKIQKPIFILQGGKDYQVTSQDLNLFETTLNNKQNVKFKFYDNLNHIFCKVDGKPTPEMYMQKNNVDAEVIKDIEKWIKTLFKE